jgi:transposase
MSSPRGQKRKKREVSPGKSRYPSTELPTDVRDALGKLYRARKLVKVSGPKFVEWCEAADLPVSLSSLKRWKKSISDVGVALSPEKKAGNKKLLDEDQMDQLVGFVVWRILEKEPVHLKTVCTFTRDSFGIPIDDSTALRYLTDNGFTHRKTQTKSGGYTMDYDFLTDLYYDWVIDHRRKIFNAYPLGFICSIDFTYTSHRSYNKKSYGVRGWCFSRFDLMRRFGCVLG